MNQSPKPGWTLVVEDDPALQRALRRLAEMAGQTVEVAATVAVALDKLGCCERILLDLNLPDGLGTSVLERIRAEGLAVRVAVVTGTNDDTLLAQVRKLGPDVIFTKPPDPVSIQN